MATHRGQDPISKAACAAEADGTNGSAYAIAVADFLQVPDIREVELSGYAGQPGDLIRVQATDDFRVLAVRVRIENGEGTLVEEGAATQQLNALAWVYTAN